MNVTCPNCKHEETQRLPDAFEHAKRQQQDAAEAASATATSQPTLAERTAPPDKGTYFPIFSFWFLLTMAVTLSRSVTATLIGYAILIVAGYLMHRVYMFNLKKWPVLFEKWQQSYICHRCGQIFPGK